jgi:uncharacterized protein YqeY/catechol 2,3-dioxygenase-like lactoylglutathione lyase family enzyme
MKLHHVQVLCPPDGEDTARAFYGSALGLVEVAKPPVLAARGGAWFRSPTGDAEIHVSVVPAFVPATKSHPAFLVPDIDVLAARLETAGYPVDWDDLFPGHRRFYTADGHGNRVEILQGVYSIRERLQADLKQALKDRDRVASSTIRSLLGSIANAEAVAAPEEDRSAAPLGVVGVGAAEADRRELSEAEILDIIRADAAERAEALEHAEQHAPPETVERLRAESGVLARYLSAGDTSGT